MNVSTTLCSLFHRSHWRFIRRKETGPAMFSVQRHVGIYRCESCGKTHRIVGDKLRTQDPSLPIDAPPPARGLAMMLHRMLGGPI